MPLTKRNAASENEIGPIHRRLGPRQSSQSVALAERIAALGEWAAAWKRDVRVRSSKHVRTFSRTCLRSRELACSSHTTFPERKDELPVVYAEA